jgi:cell division protein FtsB
MTPGIKRRLEARKNLKRFWMGILILIPLVLFWVNQTVSSTKILYQIQKLSDEIKQEENRKVALEMLCDRLTSLEFVEETARNKLGFVDPKRENIILLGQEP